MKDTQILEKDITENFQLLKVTSNNLECDQTFDTNYGLLETAKHEF